MKSIINYEEEYAKLCKWRDDVIDALRNYELNGSDVPAQIRGMYSDAEESEVFLRNKINSLQTFLKELYDSLESTASDNSLPSYWFARDLREQITEVLKG